MSNLIKVAVTGTGSLFGQAIIKSLKASTLIDRIDLTGADYFPNTPGSFWCRSNYILPDILKPAISESQWLTEVERIISKHQIKILFPGLDFELPIFAKNKERLLKDFDCRVIVCDESKIELGDDKYLTYRFLKENNLYHPVSCLPDKFKESGIGFPCIVKPRRGARSVGVFLVKNQEELRLALASARDPLIQECVGSPDSEYTCGVLCLNGEVQNSIVLKRDLKDGNTCAASYSNDFPAVIIDYITAVGNKLQAEWAINLQLRIDEEGIPKIFEINPRHSGTTYMRCLFGYNEVDMILRNVLGMNNLPVELREGNIVRYFEEILY